MSCLWSRSWRKEWVTSVMGQGAEGLDKEDLQWCVIGTWSGRNGTLEGDFGLGSTTIGLWSSNSTGSKVMTWAD